MGNLQLLGIPGHVSRLVVVLHDQLGKVAANQFTLRQVMNLVGLVPVEHRDTFMYVSIQVGGDFRSDFFGQELIHLDKQLHVFFHHLGTFGAQVDDRASQGEVHGVEEGMRLEVVFHVCGRESAEVDVQVALDTVYLKDAPGGEGDKVVGLHLYFIQVDRRFHLSGHAQDEDFTFQSYRIIGVESQQFLADAGADEPFFRQVDFGKFFFHGIQFSAKIDKKRIEAGVCRR